MTNEEWSLIRGSDVPWLIPFCASCKEGVELYTTYDIAEDGKLDIEFSCHGKTGGVRLTEQDIKRMMIEKVPIIVFQAPLARLVDVVIR